MVSLHCAGVMCLVFGIFAGVTSPAGICGIAVGSAVLCCCPNDVGCMNCGAKAGIVLAILQLIACVAAGAFFASNVENFCDVATTIVSSVCSSGRQLSLTEPPVADWLPSPAKAGHVDTALLKRTIEGSGATLLAGIMPGGPQIIKDLTKMVAKLEHAPEERHRRLNIDYCTDASSGADLTRNGICEDGGAGSSSSTCFLCYDAQDCGVRAVNDCNGCNNAQSGLSTGCDIWKTIGYVIIIAGAIVHTLLTVSFCLVLKGVAAKAKGVSPA